MVMAEQVKITKKAGNQQVSVDVFETYTTTETGQDVSAVEKVIVLTSDDETLREEQRAWMQAGIEGWERREDKQDGSQDDDL